MPNSPRISKYLHKTHAITYARIFTYVEEGELEATPGGSRSYKNGT